MSAAERLRKLDEVMTPTPWSVHLIQGRTNEDADGVTELRNALPALIEVVRAAERVSDPKDYWDWVTGYAPKLKEALRALEEALGE